MEAFHAVAGHVYAEQPAGTAPVRQSIERNLARERFTSGQQVFIAQEGDTAIARVVARVSPDLRDDAAGARPTGILGFFESVNRPDVARGLLNEAVKWLRARGVGRIVGPMDGDTWHRYRVNLGPFEKPPFPLEPWNPAYYGALWERTGFRMLESYSSKWIDDVSVLLPALDAGATRAASHGVRIRGLDKSRMNDELAVVHQLTLEIFHDAFLYTPITLQEFLALYTGVERFLDPDLVVFAITPEDKAVGFVFAYGDPGRTAVHYKTIGVREEWRKAGVAAALSRHVYANALRKGVHAGNHALMRDDNRSQTLDQGYGKVFRQYALYEWGRSAD